ncbi:universal stress protein [Geomonas subterranea]|uniref:universal stress protein n=1 Tax=Geomonas subterranea TaxID=2847989 RepID=UPI001CD80D11|nr:universal stress protein [Geomonas fuzhouensis]
MELKQILVFMDDPDHSADRLDLALNLAKRHRAGVIGLKVQPHHLIPLRRGQDQDTTGELARLFSEKTAAADVKGEWITVDAKVLGGVVEAINHYATFADLVVVGQSEHGSSERRATDFLPEKVVFGSGKPVLIVPYTGKYSCAGDKVLVAWKSGRESSRALTDAVPFLKAAASTHVFEVNPSKGEEADLEALRRYLAAHGVTAEIETSLITELHVGDVLLNRVADEGSDLLVMGAYADLHFGNYVLGDVAKHVLRHMTIPVLMSH